MTQINLNGWHRLFIIVSLIIFFDIVVVPDHGESRINWQSRSINRMDHVDCLELIKNLESAKSADDGRKMILYFN